MTTFHPSLVPEPEPEPQSVQPDQMTDEILLNAAYQTTLICIIVPVIVGILCSFSVEFTWSLSCIAAGSGMLQIAWHDRKKEQRHAVIPYSIAVICALNAMSFVMNGALEMAWMSWSFTIISILAVGVFGKRDQQLNMVAILAIQWLGTTMLLLWPATL